MKTGSVLPSFLVHDSRFQTSNFKKMFENNSLRFGIVTKIYPTDNNKNINKLVPEYDVLVIEQDSNRSITPITYKNVISAQSFGNMADYFEAALRPQKKVKDRKKTLGAEPAGQDGSIVLLLCLDGSGNKGVIIGSLPHPDRKSKVTGKGQVLAAEFNGMQILVNDDGSSSLTFKGKTDNEGNPVDKNQGNTIIDIEKDGTLQFKNKGVTKRLEKQGNVLLKNTGSLKIESDKDISITTKDKFNLKSDGNAQMSMNELIIQAQGSASLTSKSISLKGDSEVKIQGAQVDIKGDGQVKVSSSQITLDGMVFLGGAGGSPAITSQTMFIGTGNLGAMVVSQAVGPFSPKVFIS